MRDMTAQVCKQKDHQAFPVVNIHGVRLCATCWYLHEREIEARPR